MLQDSILVLGAKGMVGSAVVKNLKNNNYSNIIALDSSDGDLRKQEDVTKILEQIQPDIIILAAAKVGGIQANNIFRAQFIYDNLIIAANVINAAYQHDVSKLIFLGSSCIYPRLAQQPLKEEYLLAGELEDTNEPYAIAKIAGIKLCENYYKQYGCNFLSLMPTNLYGPNDNFNLHTSHVLPALIRKFHEAKINDSPSVKIWGTGKPKREFMFVEDLADAIRFIMENVHAMDIYDQDISHLNIGTGNDIEILQLAEMIKNIVDYKGAIEFDENKPDGTPRKLLDITRLKRLGWSHKVELQDGITKTYEWYLKNYTDLIANDYVTIEIDTPKPN